MSLAELKLKEVVNVQTGSKLGRVMDLEFSMETGQITALVVPGEFSVVNFVRGEKTGVIIPWNLILKMGDDVILVRVDESCAIQ
ncbi:MAG: YlmC/YmxH family sporulation protein [Oscillospiraceae bacterium]|jgi:YlmC/YmxH family sporulation protein|nr:YlmC/YmxH family sporulation protein [Oscillospiraceae bacterium]